MSAVDFPCSSTDAGDDRYDFEFDELADQSQSSDINFSAFDDHETLEQTVKAPNAFLQRIMAKKPGSKLQNQPEKHRVISSRFARKPLAPARVSTAPVQIRHEQPPPTIGRRGSIFEDFESQTSSEDEKPVHPTPENGAVEVSEHASSDSSFFSVKSEEEKVENGLDQFLAKMEILRDQFFAVLKRIDELQDLIKKLEAEQAEALAEDKFEVAEQVNVRLAKARQEVDVEIRSARQTIDSALVAMSDAPAYLIERTKASQEELPQLRVRQSALDKRLVSLVKQQTEENEQIEAKKRDTELAMKEVADVLEQHKRQHEEMVQRLNERIQASQEPFRVRLDELGSEIDRHKVRIEQLKAEILAYEAKVNDLNKEVERTKEEQKADMDSYNDEKVAIENDAKEIVVQEKQLLEKRTALEAPYKVMIEAVAKREKEIAAVRAVLERVDKEIHDFEKDCNECDRVIEAIHSLCDHYKEFKAATEVKIRGEEATLQKLKLSSKKKTDIEMELVKLKGFIEHANQVVFSGNEKMPEIENNKKNAVAARNFKGAQLFSQQLKEIKEQVAVAEKNLSEWLERKILIETELEEVNQTVQEQENVLQSQRSELTKCSADFYLSILKQLHMLFESAPFVTKLLGALHDLVSCAFEHSEMPKEMTSEEMEVKLTDLNEELERAIAHDDFDAAQLIQDQIDRLTSQLSSNQC